MDSGGQMQRILKRTQESAKIQSGDSTYAFLTHSSLVAIGKFDCKVDATVPEGHHRAKRKAKNTQIGQMALLRQAITKRNFAQLQYPPILHREHALEEGFGCSLQVNTPESG